jgi:hypothetical protein
MSADTHRAQFATTARPTLLAKKPAEPPPVAVPTLYARPVMFLHIPKTAGTSFISALRNIFGLNRLVRLVSIDDTTPGEIGRLLSERPGDLACLTGHVPFHMIAPWQAQCAIFTILRHPIARVMSLFRFIQRRSPAEQQRLGLHAGFTFNEFITSRHPELFVQIHDGMTRVLCGDPDLSMPDSSMFWNVAPSAKVIQAALRTLDSIDFGLAEDMNSTMRVAGGAWGVPYNLDIGHENVTDPTGATPDIGYCLEIIARNAMDLVLYQHAAGLFASRCSRFSARVAATTGHSAIYVPPVGQEVAIGSFPGLQGFHEVEPSGIAWLDSEQPNRIHFDLAMPTTRIRLHGYAIHADYPISEIVIEVNGMRVATRVCFTENRWFTLQTDPAALLHPFNVLSIRPPYFVPVRYIDPDSPDMRNLSIALANLAFEP